LLILITTFIFLVFRLFSKFFVYSQIFLPRNSEDSEENIKILLPRHFADSFLSKTHPSVRFLCSFLYLCAISCRWRLFLLFIFLKIAFPKIMLSQEKALTDKSFKNTHLHAIIFFNLFSFVTATT
jgi:hypothetical protein